MNNATAAIPASKDIVSIAPRLEKFGVAVLAPRICSLGEESCGGSEVLLWEDVAICKSVGVPVRVYGSAAREGSPVQVIPLRTNQPLVTSLEYCGAFLKREPEALLLAYNEPAVAGWAPGRAIVRFDWPTPLPRYWNWPVWRSRFHAAQYIFPSESERQIFLRTHESIPAANAIVLPNAVDLQLFRPQPRALNPGRGLRVGFAGQWIPQKGIGELLEAWRTVKSALPSAELLLAGGPKLWKNATAVQGAGLAAHSVLQAQAQGLLQCVGALPRLQMPAFWNSVDIAVLPSHSESFGLVALEALACGVPVVATSVGGLPEIVVHDENGILVPVGDSLALADALLSLLIDETRRLAFGQAARKRAESFSLKNRSRNLLHLLSIRSDEGRSHSRPRSWKRPVAGS